MARKNISSQKRSRAKTVVEVNKGAWTTEEDQTLVNYVTAHGYKNWRSVPLNAEPDTEDLTPVKLRAGTILVPFKMINLYIPDDNVDDSRQNVIKDHTLDWLEKHYLGLFEEIHFGNHFALDGQSKPKSEICRSLGAQVLIDDNPRYALECAEVGIRFLLFDFDNSYPWSKCDTTASHPLVTKVKNWEEVEEHVVSWAVS